MDGVEELVVVPRSPVAPPPGSLQGENLEDWILGVDRIGKEIRSEGIRQDGPEGLSLSMGASPQPVVLSLREVELDPRHRCPEMALVP
jgi:hypothetical protein